MIPRTESARRSGFTLLELLVVIVLLAVTAGAAVPALRGPGLTTPEQRVAAMLRDALIRARSDSRESGAVSTFALSPTDGRFWLATRDSLAIGVLPLDGDVRISATSNERVICRFDPTGPASPCAITVHGDRDVVVYVNEWSGEIRVDEHRAR